MAARLETKREDSAEESKAGRTGVGGEERRGGKSV